MSEAGKFLVVMAVAGETVAVIGSRRYFLRHFGIDLYVGGRLNPPAGWKVLIGEEAIAFTEEIAASTRRHNFEARIRKEKESTN